MCACGCQQCGLGRMAFSILPRGLGALGEIKTGSEIAVGIKYSTGGLFEDPPDIDYLVQTIIGCLYGSGAFSFVTADVSHGFFNNYLTVKGTVSTGFNMAEDIGGLVEGRIRECYPDFAPFITGRDPVAVYKVPVDPNQPRATYEVPAGTPGGLPLPDKCATKQGLEYASCKLGLDGGGAGLGFGTTGILLLLVAVVALSKR